MNPAFEESAMFENMIDLMFKDEYDVYVFDTAPTANARRLLGMSKVYAPLGQQDDEVARGGPVAARAALLHQEEGGGPADELPRRLPGARSATPATLLTDPSKTAFFFVTLPEALPIAVISRFIDWFTDFGIPVGGVVVNMVIEPGDLDAVPDFVRNRIEMQDEHLASIGDEFPGLVRAVLPLHDDEIRGPAALSATAAELFGPT